ncbi:hypothetical protein PIB30_056129 [Stylosanthes scabra]|uniref:Uncharacterized protein n=1 Tax=Stylosanthes scabra TaxID=79078 RepID=A0ABU6SJ44_9FABA|nr:hypothetical protein [Stylosanthes scabra]
MWVFTEEEHVHFEGTGFIFPVTISTVSVYGASELLTVRELESDSYRSEPLFFSLFLGLRVLVLVKGDSIRNLLSLRGKQITTLYWQAEHAFFQFSVFGVSWKAYL